MTTNFIQNLELLKFPRTGHIEGSRLQKGDEDCTHVPYSKIAGRYIVAEEKLDGANSGASFSEGAELLLQSRGHYLSGGGRERQFNLFKRWATAHESVLLACLEDRYVMYGSSTIPALGKHWRPAGNWAFSYIRRMTMKWTDIQALVPASGQAPDFQACLAAFPALEFAKTTPQGAYHPSTP